MTRPQKLKREVNLKAVLVVLACALVLGVTVRLVHGYQVNRNAAALLAQADQAAQEDQEAQAADYLAQYLGMAPTDDDVLARYARLVAKLAEHPRQRFYALALFEQVVRRNPGRDDVRREAAHLATELGSWSDARAHLQELLRVNPEDAALLRLSGQCEAGARDNAAAAERYARALKLAPQQIEWWTEYISLLRDRVRSPERADDAAREMVEANTRSPLARLEAARHFLQRRDPERAEEHLAYALGELKAQDAEILLLAAEVASARGETDQARQRLGQALSLHPRDHRPRLALARLEVQTGRRARALELLRPVLGDWPGGAHELWGLGNLLVDLGETSRAEEVVVRLRSANAPWAVNLLRARLQMHEGAWGEARGLLERSRAELPTPAIAGLADLLLAECYGRLGNPDQQLSAAGRALEASPSPAARRVVAAALAALGRTEQAIAEYRKVAGQVPEARSELARLLTARNLKLPADHQDWREVEEALKAGPPGKPVVPEAWLLGAEVLLARGKLGEARALAEGERRRDPQQVGPWLFLAGLEQREGRPDAVLPLLERAERQAGRRVEWEMARALYWSRTDQPEAGAQLRRLEEKVQGHDAQGQDRLLVTLATANARAGDLPASRRLWREVARRQPGNLEVRFVLFELALAGGARAEARRLAREIADLEGDDGPVAAWCEAARKLEEARPGDTQAFAEVRRLLGRASGARPSWSRVPLLEGRLYDREGRPDKALGRYLRAIERGEGGVALLQRAMQLLYAEGRYAEASALVRRVPGRAWASPGLGLLAAEVSLRGLTGAAGEDAEKARRWALELARKAVPADSADHLAHLWLGELCVLARRPEKAEEEFRKARALAEQAPETWAALILFLARFDRKKAEVELVNARTKLSGDKLRRILGPAYEALGRPGEAEEHYRAATALTDPLFLRDAASFYVRRGQRDKAEPYLRQILEGEVKAPEATAVWARQVLAVLVASGGTYRHFREAQALLDQNARGGKETLEDRRARGLVLATRPEHRREAIRLLEGVSSSLTSPVPEILFMLAQLYEADGNWVRASAHLHALLEEDGTNPTYLSHSIRALLRHGQASEAQEWLKKLADVAPDAWETVELRVRVLHGVGKTDEAVRALKVHAGRKDAPLAQVAALLDAFDRPAEAEKMYRAHVASSKDPAGVLLLAQHLARRGRVAEALRLCEGAWDNCPPERVASACLVVARAPKASPEQRERVVRRLTDAARKHPKSVPLQLVLAWLHDGSDSDGAASRYERALRLDPHNAVALNNLAFLLALRGGEHEKALRLIEGAIDVGGPTAELLHTRGAVHLLGGKADLAVRDLGRAVAVAPSAVRYCHLARAHLLRKDASAARGAYAKAAKLGLKEADLHPLDRSSLRQLRADLGLE